MSHEIHVPFTVEQDENGFWAAQAALKPNAYANGQGDTRDAAIDDLREALALLTEEVGAPKELTVSVQAAKHEVTVPYTVEQDEDGVWCAHALLQQGVGANGEGDTPEAAAEDLREALTGLIEEFGVPQSITVTVETP